MRNGLECNLLVFPNNCRASFSGNRSGTSCVSEHRSNVSSLLYKDVPFHKGRVNKRIIPKLDNHESERKREVLVYVIRCAPKCERSDLRINRREVETVGKKRVYVCVCVYTHTVFLHKSTFGIWHATRTESRFLPFNNISIRVAGRRRGAVCARGVFVSFNI